MRSGMKESADESDLLCFKSPGSVRSQLVRTSRAGGRIPKMTLQQFKTQMILSRGALYDLIFNNSDHAVSISPLPGLVKPSNTYLVALASRTVSRYLLLRACPDALP